MYFYSVCVIYNTINNDAFVSFNSKIRPHFDAKLRFDSAYNKMKSENENFNEIAARLTKENLKTEFFFSKDIECARAQALAFIAEKNLTKRNLKNGIPKKHYNDPSAENPFNEKLFEGNASNSEKERYHFLMNHELRQ